MLINRLYYLYKQYEADNGDKYFKNCKSF